MIFRVLIAMSVFLFHFSVVQAAAQDDPYDFSLENIWSLNAGQTFHFEMEGLFEVAITFPTDPDLRLPIHVEVKQIKGGEHFNFTDDLPPSGFDPGQTADSHGGILYYLKSNGKSLFRLGIAADGSVLLAAFLSYGTTRVPVFGKGELDGAILASIVREDDKPANACAAKFFPKLYYPQYFPKENR